ncbi:MlaD family protein [Williamsia maris]|uniref:Phospholipid/cholesterol/gamma-HCH transport system substrate-binding protein n=1 Tax=Williamsia maris TaxID=72806 RepID=A0ABT1H8T9_9NOCA|nr:MlaD family protein [Williamsia maris]MCP2174634.1 phospholipid/cholesterol/gamma-HCH transport system substrate-binding protein [Williamsia maris]
MRTVFARRVAVRRDAVAVRRRQVLFGLGGVVVIVVVAVVAGLLYVVPFGSTDVTAEFTSSGQIRSGDEVRVAGIAVGSVQSVEVVGDHVEITFDVDDSVNLRDQTSADIRLSTAIGGHYLAVTPQGTRALDGPIPRDRTSTPYELTDVITDSGDVVDKVDAQTARETFAQVNLALRGRSDSVRDIISQVAQVTTTLGDRDDDLDRAIAVTEEYVGALNDGRAKLLNLLRLVGVIGYRFYEFREQGLDTVRGVDALFAFLQPPVEALSGTIDPQIDKVQAIVDRLRTTLTGSGPVLDKLTQIANQLGSALGVSGSTPTLDLSKTVVDAPALCIPTPDRRC